MIILNPAIKQSHAGVHFSVVNGTLNAQPRSMASVEKLHWAHGGAMFDNNQAKKRLELGHAVVLLRGKQVVIPDHTATAITIEIQREVLEWLGLKIAPAAAQLPKLRQDPELVIDGNSIKSALAA